MPDNKTKDNSKDKSIKTRAIEQEQEIARLTPYPIKSMLKMGKSGVRFGSPVGNPLLQNTKEFENDLLQKATDFWPHVYDDLTLDGTCQEGRIYGTRETQRRIAVERMIQRVLILPNEEILASSAKSVPAGEVNLYPRLDLHLRPTRVPQLNELSYGEEYEEGLEGPTSPRVKEKLRRAKEFYGDVLAEFCLLVQSPVIDHRVPLTHNEAMTLPSACLLYTSPSPRD